MASRIRSDDIAEVRDRSRIDEVVGDSVTLKTAGSGSLKGLCPFHDERSPSFHVTPARGFYYCFGCGEGGDAIDFLMKHDHLSFTESVEKLAARIGYALRYEGGAPGDRPDAGNRRKILAVNAETSRFFREQLATSNAGPAREFLASRGFDEQSWADFGIGYAPRNGLVAFLRGKGYKDDDIVAAGSIGQGDRGLYDRFRHRVMWPIQDLSGDVIGFGGRRLGEEGPKYLNTPETAVYKKSQVLYGLHRSKKDIAHAQRAVVVEGYTDVMACHLAGLTTAVATCGTAFGSGHVQVLRRILMDDSNGEVVFTFDGDDAGRKAALRAYTEDQSFAAKTSVAIAPDGLDPCDLRLERGDQAVADLIETRRPLFEFVLRGKLEGIDLRTAEGRAAGIKAVAPVVAGLKDATLQPEYVRQVAGWLGVEPSQISAAMRRSTRDPRRDQGSGYNQTPPSGYDREIVPDSATQTEYGGHVDPADAQLQRTAIKLILQAPDQVGPWLESVTAECFTQPQAVLVFATIQQVGFAGVHSSGWVRSVLDACRDDDERRLVHALVTEPIPVVELTERYSVGVIARLLDRAAERGGQDLRAALGDPAVRADPARESAILTDLLEVEEYRRSLREYWAGEE